MYVWPINAALKARLGGSAPPKPAAAAWRRARGAPASKTTAAARTKPPSDQAADPLDIDAFLASVDEPGASAQSSGAGKKESMQDYLDELLG